MFKVSQLPRTGVNETGIRWDPIMDQIMDQVMDHSTDRKNNIFEKCKNQTIYKIMI